MSTVAVTPVLGEFGYQVFDVQPQLRWWLRQHRQASRRVVFAPRTLAFFFDEATEIIEPPREMLPTAHASARSVVYQQWRPGSPDRIRIERLVAWAREQVEADEWLDIPYFEPGLWQAPATFVPLRSSRFAPPEEPYVVVAARDRAFDAWRNWPKKHWDDLVARMRGEWQLPIYMIGAPPSTYYPPMAIPQEVDEEDRLEHSVMLLNNAVCSISSNSGPTHLSLMAECPTFAWGEAYLKQFMEATTNPLRTPCRFCVLDWQPSVDQVWQHLDAWKMKRESRGMWSRCHAPRPRVSMCMIARDSSATIGKALESIRPWVDEMVVVDTGSEDDTPQIAQEAGAKLGHFAWCDDFSAARNASLELASGQWVFWMDSDDTIDEQSGQKLRSVVDQDHQSSVMGLVGQVRCPGLDAGDGRTSTTVVDHIKLFRNYPALRFTGRIHEQILPAIRRLGGEVGWTGIDVVHSGADHSPEGRKRKVDRDLRLLGLELADDPDSTFALFNLGMTLLDAGRAEEALSPLARSLQLAAPTESHVRKIYALLAQAYCELSRYRAALWTCRRGLEACPDDAELLFRNGTILLELDRSAEAVMVFERLLQSVPDRVFSSVDQELQGRKAWQNLAVAYERCGRPESAMQALDEALTLAPNCWLNWEHYGRLCRSSGRLSDFASAVNRLADRVSSEELRVSVDALHAEVCGNPRYAVKIVTGYAEQAKLNEEMLGLLCRACFATEQWADAVKWLSELSKLTPDDPSVWQNLGTAQLRVGDADAAIAAIETSLRLRPSYEPAEGLLKEARRAAAPSPLARRADCVEETQLTDIVRSLQVDLAEHITMMPTTYTPDIDARVLYRLAKSMRPRRILEIGTAYGHTTIGLARNCPDADVFTVDICSELALEVPPFQIGEVLPREQVGQAFEGCDERIVQIIGDSREFQTISHLESVDLAFIDGNHSADAIICDSVNVIRICRVGGVIVWHDFKDDPSVQTIEALAELHHRLGLCIKHIAGTTLAAAQVRIEHKTAAEERGEAMCGTNVSAEQSTLTVERENHR